MSNLPICLHRGFDGLDVAFTAALRPVDLERLRAARLNAEASQTLQPVSIGPAPFSLLLSETGARGGYKFRGDSGKLGAIWFIKNRAAIEPGNIRASVHSATLATLGFTGTKTLLSNDLIAMGALGGTESISRIDFAADFLMPKDFTLDPACFSTHSHAVRREHADLSSEQYSTHISWRGRRTTSITIGKMPGRQIIVYDKRAEAVSAGKDHWFKIWNIDQRDSSASVWRVELRFGKSYLSDKARIFSYSDLDTQIKGHFLKLLDDFRYLQTPDDASNISRVPSHPLWHAMAKTISESLFSFEGSIEPKALLDSMRRKALDRRKKLVGSLIPGIVALEGYDPEEGRQLAGRLAEDSAKAFSEWAPIAFRKRVIEIAQQFDISFHQPGSNRTKWRPGS